MYMFNVKNGYKYTFSIYYTNFEYDVLYMKRITKEINKISIIPHMNGSLFINTIKEALLKI